MKFSEQWLREWIDPPLTTDELVEQLTMAGLEVDSASPAAEPFSGVVVGEVLSVRPHPEAERLRVCEVDVGAAQPLQVVCGADNVRPGMRAATAKVGARLRDGLEIKRAKLRGIESSGMLCSASELGLAESSTGLMELPDDAPKGQDVRAALNLDDACIDVDLTPNRGDCLSIAGIAREVGVLNRCPVNTPAEKKIEPLIEDRFEIRVDAPADCPRYLGRVIRGVDPTAKTPYWLQERLRRSGLRSLGPMVDVTNVVLLELGQPMHAFDLDQLRGGIVVRRARAGECLTLLDGQDVILDAETLVIADHERPVAMAGIMGGADTAVGEGTRDLFLECAFFSPTAIAGRARRYSLHTDSSHRFERGVDPAVQQRAMERATELILPIVGGRPGPVAACAHLEHLPQRSPIRLRHERVKRLLGTEIPAEEIAEILERLGMHLRPGSGEWWVEPPSYRFDIAIEADLIEELARIYGYSRLPTSRPRGEWAIRSQPETGFDLLRAKRLLVDRDYQEAITFSFVDPVLQQRLDSEETPIELANPISSEESVMRTSLWPGLIQALAYNRKRQQARVRLFESGLRFLRRRDSIVQEPMLAAVAIGGSDPEQWGQPDRAVDFYDVKADVEAVLALTGAWDAFRFVPARHPALHPGQCARIERDDETVGWLGMLHPALERELEVGSHAYVFELRLDSVAQGRLPAFQPLSKFPSIRRDLAIVVNERVTAEAVRGCVAASMPRVLQELRIFDVYRGKGVAAGHKSLALGLILQENSRTLMDDEVDRMITSVVVRLTRELGAMLRE